MILTQDLGHKNERLCFKCEVFVCQIGKGGGILVSVICLLDKESPEKILSELSIG